MKIVTLPSGLKYGTAKINGHFHFARGYTNIEVIKELININRLNTRQHA